MDPFASRGDRGRRGPSISLGVASDSPGSMRLVVEGDLVASTVGEFEEALDELMTESADELIIDLTAVESLDKHGRHALVRARYSPRRHVVFGRMSPNVEAHLEQTGLLRYLLT